jgi:hypothetical protein
MNSGRRCVASFIGFPQAQPAIAAVDTCSLSSRQKAFQVTPIGGTGSLQVKGDDPSLSVHRRKVPGQGRPQVAGFARMLAPPKGYR